MSDEDFITDNKDGTHSVSTTVLLANYRHLEAELQRTQLAAAELATTAARATAEQQQACTRVAEVEAELRAERRALSLALGRVARATSAAESFGRMLDMLVERPVIRNYLNEILAALKGPA